MFAQSRRRRLHARVGQPSRLAQSEGHLDGDGHRHGLVHVLRWAKHPLCKSTLCLCVEAWLKRLQNPNVTDSAAAVDNALENDATLDLRAHRIRSELCVNLAKGDGQLN